LHQTAEPMNFPKSMLRNAFRFRTAALAAVLAGCSGNGGTNPPVAARLGMATEPGQTAQSGVPVNPQPSVQVLDADGAPFATNGVLITASLASGGGTLGGTLGVRTDANGRAAFTDLVLGGPVGPRTLRFSATGLSAVISRAIDLSSGPASIAVIHAGNSQTTAAGTPVPVAPSVRVTDAASNPVVGVRVTFAVIAGGGTVAGQQPLTNAQGIATLGQWTLGPAIGQNTLTAVIDGVLAPLTFQATGTVGPAANLTLVEGDGQNATIGTAVAVSPAVKVTDAFGNIVSGVTVNFAVGSGGGSLTGNVPITDANGVARVGAWRLGFLPGVNTLTATREGIPPVSFTANSTDFPVVSITSGIAHACAVGTDNIARCWGDNSTSQLGDGSINPDSIPVTVSTSQVFTQVDAGDGHTCGLTATGEVFCWGNNTSGELGDGTTTNSAVPVPLVGGITFTFISTSGIHTCGLDTARAIWCWGNGNNGRLGDGFELSRVAPVQVAGGHQWTDVAAGASHTCGRKTDGVVMCWGNNANGRLGDNTTTERLLPTPVSVPPGAPATYVNVSAGGNFTCAMELSGAAWCWGAGASGQIGDGANAQRNVPTRVQGGHLFTRVTTGSLHACGIDTLFNVFCWGEGSSGRLGDGTGTDKNVPVPILGGLSYTIINAGDQHTCGRSTSGSAICWGNNLFGQLGDGTQAGKATPVGVRHP
jgi:alpha-tubulin suppressor-like RCC1 family protein